jgi:DNA-binding NtrC family response regulator
MEPRGSILLVDDEEKILKALGRALRDEGHEVVAASSAREAQKLLASRPFDLLVVDNRMPDKTGLELIKELVSSTGEGERPQIIMMTAHATVENAIAAMKLGAFDYLQKPFEVDELLVGTRRALEHQRLRTQNRYLLSEREEEFDHYGIVGRSRAIQEVIRQIELVAQSRSTVLITGETGTGKELVARAIHDRSAQREMPLIKVNCAALPEGLLESELFGHVKGAFTGATTSKKGKFALADGGTIFLDEIGTMTPAVQAKLLRVLQEREFEPLGAERTEKVDLRVIAASNRPLPEYVKQGRFREDLFYRLNVIPLTIPPLRERPEDIPPLARHFLIDSNAAFHRKVCGFRPAAEQALLAYDWPGNVRELKNLIERVVILHAAEWIEAQDLPLPAGPEAPGSEGPLQTLDDMERRYILRVVELLDGNKSRAAKVLGISRQTLRRKVESG